MSKKRKGRIINIASVVGVLGNAGQVRPPPAVYAERERAHVCWRCVVSGAAWRGCGQVRPPPAVYAEREGERERERERELTLAGDVS
jgi:NAD(P)-dependent dehydrogenase (short-subunit alcohol dehydrogenase family)